MRQDNFNLDHWLNWADEVETQLDHSLDGCLASDGYSMGAAMDLYDAETSVEAAVAHFEATKLTALIASANPDNDYCGQTRLWDLVDGVLS